MEAPAFEDDESFNRAEELLIECKPILAFTASREMARNPDVPLVAFVADAAGARLLRAVIRPPRTMKVFSGVLPRELAERLLRSHFPESLHFHSEDRERPVRRLPVLIFVGNNLETGYIECPVAA